MKKTQGIGSKDSGRTCALDKGTLVRCQWECKLVKPLWKTVWRVLKKLKLELPYGPAIPLLGIYPEKLKTLIQKHAPQCSQQHYLQ